MEIVNLMMAVLQDAKLLQGIHVQLLGLLAFFSVETVS